MIKLSQFFFFLPPRHREETADIHFIHRWSVSLSVGQDYTQSNPEWRRKQGQSSAWSSHHLCACPGYWAVLCFTPQINPTWALTESCKHSILAKPEGHVHLYSQTTWIARDTWTVSGHLHSWVKVICQTLSCKHVEKWHSGFCWTWNLGFFFF